VKTAVGDSIAVSVAVGSEIAVAVGVGVEVDGVEVDSGVAVTVERTIGVAGSVAPFVTFRSNVHWAHELNTMHAITSIIVFSAIRTAPGIGKPFIIS
jgi:hypothetical protein